jgi:hypothetical protein
MPLGELDRGFSKIAARGTCAVTMQNSLEKLRSWGGPNLLDEIPSQSSSPIQWKAWPTSDVKSLDEFAKLHWGNYSCCMRGAPSRLVLIAPDFNKDCIELAEYLRKRFVPIELIRANLFNSSKYGIYAVPKASRTEWLSWCSIRTTGRCNTSSRMVRADARNPWAVASSFVKPILRRAAFKALSLMHRNGDRWQGKTYFPLPVSGCNDSRTLIA